MKDILKTEEFVVPAGVTVDLKSRIINVEGPRGKLTKNVRHVNMDIQLVRGTTFALKCSAVEETVVLTDTSLVVCCALLDGCA
jgi:ribosomal protein L6P/L9E